MEASVLTEEQKRQWREDGYIILESVLSAEEVENLTAVVDQMYGESLQQPDAKPDAGFNQLNIVEDNDIFLNMIDHPVGFPIVLELLGPYIQVAMSQAIIRQPNPDNKGIAHALHADGGPAMRQLRVDESSFPLQIKIQYFLTDLEEPDSGNFTLVPGTHSRPYPEDQLGVADSPLVAEAVQVCVKTGGAVVFPHALWHGAAAHTSGQPRKSLIYCYNHHCFRPYDYEKAAPELLAKSTPRQQRLLGDIGGWRSGGYYYSPSDQVEVITGSEEKKE